MRIHRRLFPQQPSLRRCSAGLLLLGAAMCASAEENETPDRLPAVRRDELAQDEARLPGTLAVENLKIATAWGVANIDSAQLRALLGPGERRLPGDQIIAVLHDGSAWSGTLKSGSIRFTTDTPQTFELSHGRFDAVYRPLIGSGSASSALLLSTVDGCRLPISELTEQTLAVQTPFGPVRLSWTALAAIVRPAEAPTLLMAEGLGGTKVPVTPVEAKLVAQVRGLGRIEVPWSRINGLRQAQTPDADGQPQLNLGSQLRLVGGLATTQVALLVPELGLTQIASSDIAQLVVEEPAQGLVSITTVEGRGWKGQIDQGRLRVRDHLLGEVAVSTGLALEFNASPAIGPKPGKKDKKPKKEPKPGVQAPAPGGERVLETVEEAAAPGGF
jgi:hypothetical protein